MELTRDDNGTIVLCVTRRQFARLTAGLNERKTGERLATISPARRLQHILAFSCGSPLTRETAHELYEETRREAVPPIRIVVRRGLLRKQRTIDFEAAQSPRPLEQ